MLNDMIKVFLHGKTIHTQLSRAKIHTVLLCLRKMSTEKPLITPLEEARRFMIDCFKAVGTNQTHAEIVADNLLEADYRGHYSHGMNRLNMYLNDIKSGVTKPNALPTIDQETEATAVVNGHNGLGAVIGQSCMDLAIEKAAKVGIGMVVCHHSNHYGIAGVYAIQAIKRGFIGFSATNTSPLMVPTRAKQAALGTNPITLGVPALDGDSFLLDMATTAVAVGKIELSLRKGKDIPSGWALNKDGCVETDANIAYESKRLLPLGGTESNSGYKGFGLGMLVEVLCGILSGSSYGPNIRSWSTSDVEANLGQCYIAIDPKVFAPGVENRMSDLMNNIRKMEPVDSSNPVIVHGDPEKMHMEKVHKDGGLIYVQNQHNTNMKLAHMLQVTPMCAI